MLYICIHVYIHGHNYSYFQEDVSTCKLCRFEDNIKFKNHESSFLKKVIKQKILKRWVFVEAKAISGQERRTLSDSGSHVYCLFQKLL